MAPLTLSEVGLVVFPSSVFEGVPIGSRYYFHRDHYAKKSEKLRFDGQATIKEPSTLLDSFFPYRIFSYSSWQIEARLWFGLHRYVSYEVRT